MLTLVAMTLALAARGYAPVNGLQLYYEIHGNPAKNEGDCSGCGAVAMYAFLNSAGMSSSSA